MIRELFMFVSYLFFGIIFLMLMLAACSYVKEKLVDLFGHELKNSNKTVRKAYVMKMTDENQLKDIALNDYDFDVKLAALSGIDDDELLREVGKGSHKSVSRIAGRKIKEI